MREELNNSLFKNQWNDEKDINLFTAGNEHVAKWKCSIGHTWKTTVILRTKNKHNCPYCSNRKILTGFNDLKSQRPELMKDWDFNNNSLNPEETSIHRNEKAWWICSVCHHEWKALISNRSRGFGCPQCSGAVSKQEKSLLTFIQSHIAKDIVIVENDKTIIKPKEIDIYIPDMKIGFEYNGIYWHDKQRYIHDEENSPEYQKTLLCREGGVTLLHVWSDDWLHNTSRTQQEILEFLANNRYNS